VAAVSWSLLVSFESAGKSADLYTICLTDNWTAGGINMTGRAMGPLMQVAMPRIRGMGLDAGSIQERFYRGWERACEVLHGQVMEPKDFDDWDDEVLKETMSLALVHAGFRTRQEHDSLFYNESFYPNPEQVVFE